MRLMKYFTFRVNVSNVEKFKEIYNRNVIKKMDINDIINIITWYKIMYYVYIYLLKISLISLKFRRNSNSLLSNFKRRSRKQKHFHQPRVPQRTTLSSQLGWALTSQTKNTLLRVHASEVSRLFVATCGQTVVQ